MNRIKFPSELRSFLLIFDLVTPSRAYQFAIPLPAPLKDGLLIYDKIREVLGEGNSNIETEHIAEDDFLRNEELATNPIGIWKSDILSE